MGSAAVGVDPRIMGIGPIYAIEKLLKQTGLTLDDMELFEINEAFAAPSVAVEKELGLNRDIVNVNGSGIALGHPIENTGCLIVVSLIHEMEKRGLSRGWRLFAEVAATVRPLLLNGWSPFLNPLRTASGRKL